MRKVIGSLTGVAISLFLLILVLYLGNLGSADHHSSSLQMEASILSLVALLPLLIFLMVMYMLDIIKQSTLPVRSKIVWVTAVYTLSLVVMPVYWWKIFGKQNGCRRA